METEPRRPSRDRNLVASMNGLVSRTPRRIGWGDVREPSSPCVGGLADLALVDWSVLEDEGFENIQHKEHGEGAGLVARSSSSTPLCPAHLVKRCFSKLKLFGRVATGSRKQQDTISPLSQSSRQSWLG